MSWVSFSTLYSIQHPFPAPCICLPPTAGKSPVPFSHPPSYLLASRKDPELGFSPSLSTLGTEMAVGPPEDCKSSDFSPRLPGEGLSVCVFPHCHPFSLPSHRPFAGTSGPPCLPSDLPLVLPHPDPGPTLRIGLHVSPPHPMQCSLPALPKTTHLCQVNCSSWYLHSEVSRANRAMQYYRRVGQGTTDFIYVITAIVVLLLY